MLCRIAYENKEIWMFFDCCEDRENSFLRDSGGAVECIFLVTRIVNIPESRH